MSSWVRVPGASSEYGRRVVRFDTPEGRIDFFDELPRLGWARDDGRMIVRYTPATDGDLSIPYLDLSIVAAIKLLVPGDCPKRRTHLRDVRYLSTEHYL